MAHPVWAFFLRRDISGRVTSLPPCTLSGLAASRQVSLETTESPDLFIVPPRLQIKTEGKVPRFKSYPHIISIKN